MADTYTNILLHIVFSTKHRRPFITPEIKPRLYAYMGGIIRKNKGVLYEIGGMPDHVHLLVRWNTDAIKDLVREMKAESSKWVKQTFPGNRLFRWQTGGGIFSVSQSQKHRVDAYIRDQVRHHRRRTFEEEYIALLEKHGIEYDLEHVFD